MEEGRWPLWKLGSIPLGNPAYTAECISETSHWRSHQVPLEMGKKATQPPSPPAVGYKNFASLAIDLRVRPGSSANAPNEPLRIARACSGQLQ